ncbi:alpha/beta hydrolase [Metabacillus sediminilitoris]|uniref:Alpha/beta hydrolase n=2 Tax=Metabacillus sediminilitoris TaxID=2567941 RepID=A0A4S4BRK0_9BACI|nr:alpha/beta fold hydrolase [Metabacillus sediminilitoris]THF75297.1 alpha/beta hydrolase [Metabacillus sediminilitoris]
MRNNRSKNAVGVDIMTNFALIDGKKIAYDDLGEGTPVIFIHPPGMGRKVFYYQRKLSDHMRVIFPDLSGHGESSRINAKEVSIDYYSKELVAFLDQLKVTRAIFCGYSAGGAIAQYISIHFPDRVEGLILSGGYPAVLNKSLRWEHHAGMYMVKKHKKLLSRILAISHTKNEDLRNILFLHMNKAQKDVWYNYYKMVLHMNLIHQLNNINVPSLLMYGTKSDLINKYAEFFKKKLKRQHRIVFFKQSTHQLPTRRWRHVNDEIIQYVQKLETAPK